jgi:hypothetical protein
MGILIGGEMDPFRGLANIAKAGLIIVAVIIVISALMLAFRGNFIGLLIVLIVVVFSI